RLRPPEDRPDPGRPVVELPGLARVAGAVIREQDGLGGCEGISRNIQDRELNEHKAFREWALYLYSIFNFLSSIDSFTESGSGNGEGRAGPKRLRRRR